ncbi:DNA damage-inducible protein D [Dyella sp. LX-66]|uniref:DNA damage-inducible protein D n=1 Tax=unclassified Dyella TaxID=2634549 RepID=UPI001BDFC2A3|nr:MULTISPECIES: DNA damage-inducible protein D [unclassified Dyella]MBT2117759.1 DNA damage-inducible protein D [Dyella sp. LX-1]MBT2141274.1 DNA damage-inducible protein D [Dyella sp. LX-66]
MALPAGSKQGKTFEEIRHVAEDGAEYWRARELAVVLEYSQYRNFQPVIERAIEACRNSGLSPRDHFAQIHTMVDIGSGGQRRVEDWKLSRYACYLIVQNGDPSKPLIAQGQTYFAVQARLQEVADSEQFERLSEEDRRLMLRSEMTHHNRALVAAARGAGVATALDYAIFQDHGYKGLYGGLGAKDIHQHKRLKKSQKILDHMGSTELAANLFRATQAEEKIRRDRIQGKTQANQAHHDVGRKVRKTIKELGGTMPEKLPVPDKGIPQLERERAKRLKKKGD